jgi:hypothetical protein
MDTLNYDVSNIIFKQLSIFDRLRLNNVFNEPRPTQFQVSSELIALKNFRGDKGLFMLATTNGEYEPCVNAMIMIAKLSDPDIDMTAYDEFLRSYYDDFNTDTRIELVNLAYNSYKHFCV